VAGKAAPPSSAAIHAGKGRREAWDAVTGDRRSGTCGARSFAETV